MKGIRFFQTIQARLIIIYVLLILIAMQLIGIYFVKTLETTLTTNFSNNLNKQADLLALYVEPYLSAKPDGKTPEETKKSYDELSVVVNNLFTISNAEIQVIDLNGVVITTSQQSHQSIIGQKNTQTEVSRALQNIKSEGNVVDADGVRKKVIANPVTTAGKVNGVVYIVASMKDLFETMNRINQILISGTLIALALTAVLGVILSHTITNPIKEITKQATEVAEGNFSRQVKVLSNDEIGQLGNAFNFMTNRLKEEMSLNESEKEKLSSILANMSDGVVAADDRGKVIVINRRAKQILQVEEENSLGQDLASLFRIGKEEMGQYIMGKDKTAMITLELPNEEEPLALKVAFTSIQRKGNEVAGTIAVLQDVTEQEKLEQSRREFVANVSHELRTPLTTIRSYLEALEDGAIDDAPLAHRFVGVTRNETERMIRLVTDLLHLSRLDSNQEVFAKKPANMAEMLEEVADRFSFQMQQRKIEIRLSVEQGIGSIRIDRDQIDQVLDNLVSNAIKYTAEEGVIEISVRKLGPDWLEIGVKDTGIGIPKKDLHRIFERFYRVDKARSRNMGGTGLGLSIAREIIKAHGGTITLESEINQGTKVTFTLPTKAGQESEAL